VGKEHVGTSAIEEWEAEKQQSERPALDAARRGPKKHPEALSSHARSEVDLVTGRSSSPLIGQEERDTARAPRQRHFKNLVILSSSSPTQIPETQQEESPRPGDIAVEVNRPIDFDSQDYAIATDSQVERNLGTQSTQSTQGTRGAQDTQGTAASKALSEEDSTLGSSIPPDSPFQLAAGHSTIQESSSQVLPPIPSASSTFQKRSAAGASISRTIATSGVDFFSAGQPIEQSSSSSPRSPLFFADEEDTDLQPLSDPNRLEEESSTEGELEVLPILDSTAAGSAVSRVQVEQSQGEGQVYPHIASTSPVPAEFIEAPNLCGNSTPAVREGSEQPADTISTPIQSSPALSSGRFYSQLSSQDAPATHTECPLAASSSKSPHKLSVTIPSLLKSLAAQSSQSFSEPTSPTGKTPSSIPFLRHPTTSPHDSIFSSGSNLSPIQADMANSHRESSPRVQRPPSASIERTPELSLREKLRQLRATSRASESSRSRNQGISETPRSPTIASVETRSVSRLSPLQGTQSAAILCTAAEDQAIPSLENVEGSNTEMVVDRTDVERASSSSLAPPLPVVHAASENSTVEMEDHENEKTVSELDIATMPLLRPSEFVIPLPVDGRIKHQYLAVLKEKDEDINDFFNSPRSPRLISSMVQMIRQLNDTVVHTDLGLEGPATQIASTTEEALWAEDASSKFAFLGRLISTLRGSHHHIVVLARSGTTQDILRSYLQGKHINFQQHSETESMINSQQSGRDDPMKYTLLATDQDSVKKIPSSASLILAFDDSFEASILPEWLSTTRFVPILLLLVVNSAEHVGRCIPQDIPEPERIRRLVKAVWHVQNELGEMSLHLDLSHAFSLALVKKDLGAKIAHAASQVADALQSDNFALNFAPSPISELDLSGLEDEPPSTEQSKEVSSRPSRAGTPAGQKRLRVSQTHPEINAYSNRCTG
jgi:Class II histone deacetylase complex subunits 2 and 3